MSDLVKECGETVKKEDVEFEIVHRTTIVEERILKIRTSSGDTAAVETKEDVLPGRKRENEEQVEKASGDVIKSSKIATAEDRHRLVEARHSVYPDPRIALKNLKAISTNVHVVGRVLVKFTKETTSNQGHANKVTNLLITDGTKVISVQAWSSSLHLLADVDVNKVYEIRHIDVKQRRKYGDRHFSWTELPPINQTLLISTKENTRLVEMQEKDELKFPQLAFNFTAFKSFAEQTPGTAHNLVGYVVNIDFLKDGNTDKPYLVLCNKEGTRQVLIKDMKPYQVEQWATLLQPQTIENFVTVVAVKDVEFIDVTTADDGNTVINCLAFDDTVVSLGDPFQKIV